MTRRLINTLITTFIFLVWALSLPGVKANRESSQPLEATPTIPNPQLMLNLKQMGWPELAFRAVVDLPESVQATVSARPLGLTQGDVNEDGRPDLITTYIGAGVARLSVRFGDGRGGFSESSFFNLVGSRPTSLAVEDVNLDGHLDVIVAYDDLEAISVLEGTGTGSFGPVKEYAVGSAAQALAAADFDKDGYVDAAVACATSGRVMLLRGNGNGFESPLPLYTWPADTALEPVAMQAADLDQDGLFDLVLTHRHGLEVLLAAHAYEPTTYAASNGLFTAMALGDFNADELTDIVLADAAGDLMVLLGDRRRGFLSPLTLITGVKIKALAVAHLDEDGNLDVALVGDNQDEVTLLLGDGHGGFRAVSSLPVRGGPTVAMAARLNKDALDDLVIAKGDGGSVAIAMSAAPQLVVNTTRDVMDIPANGQVSSLPGPDGLVSLREAIVAANNTPGAQDIVFNIPRSDPGFDGTVFRLQVTSSLPALSGGGTAIDATTQTLLTGNTNPAGPEVVLDGRSAGRIVDGLTLTSSLNVVQGLVINNFSGSGVKIVGQAIANLVVGNFIGTDETGTQARPNQFFGVIIASNGSQANIIGGTAPEDRNVISGNANSGVALNFPTFDNRVVGNYIGTTATGRAALPNGGDGVFLSSVRNNIIGGITPGSRNLISGNVRNGVSLEAGTNNQVVGNFIGTDVTGTAALPNSGNGVIVSNGAQATLIGAVGALAGNVIAGNVGNGVQISNSVSTNILGNFIGTDRSGTVALANGGHGVMINATDNRIGGFIPQARNVISGNLRSGISLDAGSALNSVLGNFIGVDVTGVAVLPNNGDGVSLIDSTNNVVGGFTPGSGNVISCNRNNGVTLLRAANNQIAGNSIGTDGIGAACLGNAKDGIRIQDSVGNRIESNTITCSGLAGISVVAASMNNRITRNAIFNNGTLGIDLNDDGVTLNDPSDLDTGPNDLRNFPIITSVTETAGGMMISGFLPNLMASLQTIELFRAMPDPTGHGEGGQYLGQTTPDGAGNFSFFMPQPTGESPQAVALANGDQLTATATDIAGNTSEFSPNFTIGLGDTLAPRVIVLSPNGGELVNAGDPLMIRWLASDNIAVVAQDVLLSTDGGRTFRPLQTNLSGSIQQITVQVPVVIDTAQARICVVVRDGAGNQARDCSDGDFVIFGRDLFPPTVLLNSPNGGEIIAAGSPFSISWTATDDRPGLSCTLLLSTDGGATYNTLVAGLTGTQSYLWQVPATLSTTAARIRVVCRDSAGTTSQDESDAPFAIDRSAPAVRVMSPNGGELSILLGAPLRIQWMSSDDVAVASHDILLSTDGGATFAPIVTGLPGAAQSYAWVVPHGTRSWRAMIRVVARDFVGRTTQDDSDRTFVVIRF